MNVNITNRQSRFGLLGVAKSKKTFWKNIKFQTVFKPRPSVHPWILVTRIKFRLCLGCLCANGDGGTSFEFSEDYHPKINH
jgi:hypothetical protein